ncbi:hypothetical protein MIMGU_mgv1a019088mg [Erythranthe guttata]|uniref:C2H2-type domain-containing protein n=1 Tax=Erythranthe guttata TaxID=4155 RepID=A0A022PV15_ERYGU|nr:PREDICTED: zinc finger protein 1-like [Erythranthe guttata]EYU19364.1 hypothetical protein MIMGU_mgv1a019088mg [Erythranthe guttata]|eukprot:XP_012858993.1 PREDICTED: zinc finger protein 1-like [Erythranthe guttata]
MALDRSLNSLKNSRRFDFLDVGSWKKSSRRSKRWCQLKLGVDEILAAQGLVMLSRTGGGSYPSPPAAAAAAKHDGDNPVRPVTTTISAAASLNYSDFKISQESVPTTPSPPPAVPKSYRSCVNCGKGFNSYQALGGHKTSCRLKPTIAAAIDRNPYAVIPAVAVISAVAKCNSGMNRSGYNLHECERCHKTFTSGQALGGHKRKHYEGVIGAGSKKSRKTSSNGSAASPKMILDFDLNLPPLPDQDFEF